MTRINRTFVLALLLLAPASAFAERDHLAGLIVKDLDKIQPPATYTIDTELGAVTCELKKAKFLLVDAEKNAGDDPRGENPGQFVCYTAKCTDPTEGVTEADDQFGAHSLERKKVKIVCAPTAGPAACGNNLTEGTEACDGTDDDACPDFCQADCTCGVAPLVCCEHPSGQACTGGQTASQCTTSGGVPGTSTDFCGDSGECSVAIAWPGTCCQVEGEPDSCIQPVSEFDCDMLGGQYLLGQTCTAAGSCIDPKLIFVTSTTHTGNLGGLSGADSICQARAAAGVLPGTYRAWLSVPGTNAADRMTHATVPYMRWDGTIVADNWDDLVDGTLDAPINVSDAGTLINSANVWTATTSSGTYSAVAGSCSNWTSSSVETAVVGVVPEVDAGWTQGGTNPCNFASRLYCMEQ